MTRRQRVHLGLAALVAAAASVATTRPEGGWGVNAPEPMRESMRLMPDAPAQSRRYTVHLNAVATEGNRRHFPINELHLFLDGRWDFDGEGGRDAGIDILASVAGAEPMLVWKLSLRESTGEFRDRVQVPARPEDTGCVAGQPCDIELTVTMKMHGVDSGEVEVLWTMGTRAFSDMSLRRDRKPLTGAAVTVVPR